MRNLIRLAVKFNHILLFLLLQALAFLLLFQNNSYHHGSFVNSSNRMIGSLMEGWSSITDHFDLESENERLAAENAQLRGQLESAWLTRINGHGVRLHNDTSYEQQYTYTDAHVINRTVSKQHNYFTINKGSLDGIRKDQGVMGPNGLVGYVKEVSPHYAVVLLVINLNFSTSAMVQGTSSTGVIEWTGEDNQLASLKDLPQHAQLSPGDTVVTTAQSGRYPAEVAIGIVEQVERELAGDGGGYQWASIRLISNFPEMQHVYVIDNHLRKEQQNLENLVQEP